MARKPNFDFERREREKAKAAKSAQKAEAKKLKNSDIAATDETESSTPDARDGALETKPAPGGSA